MLKLANQIIDAYDDISKDGLRKLASKDSSIYMMSSLEKSRLHDDDYALSAITKKASKLNKFPIDSHDNAWLSNHYFDMNCSKLPAQAAGIAAHHIKTACLRFGIEPTPAVEALAKEASDNVYYEGENDRAVLTDQSSTSLEKFAEVQKIGDNYTYAQYVFKSPAHVKIAGKYFDEAYEKMPVEYRHKYAAAIQRRASELGMPVQKGSVVKYASDNYSAMVDAHIRSRISLLEISNPSMAESLNKLASHKDQLSPTEFAMTLHGFDKRAKLEQYYGGHLTNPYEATFASAPDPGKFRIKTASGTSLSGDELAGLVAAKGDKLKEYFGTSVVAEMTKFPTAIFESLPDDAKEVIVGIANGTL